MHYRFHGPRRTGNTASGKWQRLAHSGVGTVLAESDGTWRIRVTHRRTGTSIRRDVYSVIIEGDHQVAKSSYPDLPARTPRSKPLGNA
jgi:hypothetical protein